MVVAALAGALFLWWRWFEGFDRHDTEYGAVPVFRPVGDRRADAAAAASAFRDTHLFAAGRGQHTFPAANRWLALLNGRYVPVGIDRELRTWGGVIVEGRRPLGMFDVTEQGAPIGVVGCVACHGGRAAGRTVIGLGNKNIDTGRIAELQLISAWVYRWTAPLRPPVQRELIDRALQYLRRLANEHANQTQGLVASATVAASLVALAGGTDATEVYRGETKVPHLWGFGLKRRVGLFADGFGEGSTAGWLAGVELVGGQTPEAVRGYTDRLDNIASMLEALLPPLYPYPMDAVKAARGKRLFEAGCSRCHGTYRRDSEGLPIYEGLRHVPIETVGTDPERLRHVGPTLRLAMQVGPLADIIRATDLPPGYVAPRLEGVWSRFAYLHNASVPSLWALLTPPGSRPVAWSLRDAGEEVRFDQRSVGLTMPAAGSAEEAALLWRGESGARDVYYTGRVGHSSQGHAFGTRLPDIDKLALIEYLKTL